MGDCNCCTKLGAPQICPRCGAYNPSGRQLPEQCWNCGKFIDKVGIVIEKDES